MDNTNVRKWVLKNLKLHGFSVRAEAAAYLASQLAPFDEEKKQAWLSKIIKKIQELKLDTIAIDKQHIEICLDECTKKQPSSETIFNVISAFDIPRFRFDLEKNKFLKDSESDRPTLLTSANTKSEIHRRRYSIILQRIQRHKSFQKQLFGEKNAAFQLRTAEMYLCASKKISRAVMLGLLVQRGINYFELEDPTGSIRLDLSSCKFHEGLITEHCFVLAEGVYHDKVFYALGLGNPPAEKSVTSRPFFGELNTFGGSSEMSLTKSVSLFKIQNENRDALLVILSDIWLDNIKVLSKLKKLFEGFQDCPPVAFIFMGNFLSLQPCAAYPSKLKSAFRTFAELVASVPYVCQRSHFVFVPGPADPGSPLVFPRPPLPQYLTEDLKNKIPNLHLATNPCRIQYCTKEIVVIREDLLTKMCRNVIHFPSEGDITQHFTKTLVCNSTLTPLSLYTWPTYWAHTAAMDLYPLPDLVIIGDQFNSFASEYMDCKIVNPSSFLRNGFSFQVYIPGTDKIEESRISDEND